MKVEKKIGTTTSQPSDPNTLMFQKSKNISPQANKNYKEIKSYKPTGNLIYNTDLLKTIQDKSKM